ncbi:Calmodulin-binding transcription activator 2 [Euphorbia peplus]|nr:Calmodulin-binding transcription activator 2 [Euphorbia peplus]
MADRGSSFALGPRLDIQQLFLEAQHRWLRPAEICEILRNYQKFHIASEPPTRPPSGSLFLFDRKVLRYFRKDGHNWRKKKDGKTVKEAHEKLKVGSIDVLHCYYAHGEDNESFQRRSYWMLEQELMHIVFVHYLEVKGNRTNNSPSNSLVTSHNKEPSGNTDSTSPTSTLSSYCEDADSADSQQTSSGHYSLLEPQQMQNGPVTVQRNGGMSSSPYLHTTPHNLGGQSSIPAIHQYSYVQGGGQGKIDGTSINDFQSLTSWEEVLEQCNRGNKPDATGISRSKILGEIIDVEDYGGSLPTESQWQVPYQNNSLHSHNGQIYQTAVDLGLTYDLDTRLFEQTGYDGGLHNTLEGFLSGPLQHNGELLDGSLHTAFTNAEPQCLPQGGSENGIPVEDNNKHNFVKKPLLDGEEGFKKVDSFSRWVSRELADVDDLHMRSSSGLSWSTVECENAVNDSSLSPSVSQDQLFSIIDFSPKWAYADSKLEVHVIGTFLKSWQDVVMYNWSCMFGEVEVPAEILADGILCCFAPPHSAGRVPFYVTCSNRVACSEVREFDYQEGSADDVDVIGTYGGNTSDMLLHLRFERLLSLRSSCPPSSGFDDVREKRVLISKIISLREDDECYFAEPTSERGLSQEEIRMKFLQKALQAKLYPWLLHVVAGSAKGLIVLDDDGQSVLHLAAALGYDWAIKPTVTAGVNINFRDVNGWTALHWAAFYGREQTVAALVLLGADTRALTDPSPEFPLGSTPADLASGNGQKGISGFLAESSLTSYLHLLTLAESKEGSDSEVSGTTAVQTIAERAATPGSDGDMPNVLSLKDSLSAVRNATQAANRIYQVFRMQSFQRKQLTEYDSDESSILDERAFAVAAAKMRRPMHSDGVVNAAAVRIQKKFRGYKKRKEFLIIRQRIVKIQAHIRGHQVRKQFRTIIWSVGILEKVILRWRRKGSGLRGFRKEPITREEPPKVQELPPPTIEDDYDFLKEGRKQNEVRQEKALTRVKSMYHSPEGQAQYRRLLTYFEKFRDTKESEMEFSSPNEFVSGVDDLVDIDSLLDDDTFMSIAFE